MKRVGIVGAGQYGRRLARSLAQAGVEVLLVDRNRQLVQEMSAVVECAVTGDATHRSTLEEAGFQECDVAVIAVGSNVEVSALATAICLELHVPKVYAKASSDMHGRILEKIGADKVFYPDMESANRMAHLISTGNEFDFLDVSEGYSVAEIDVPDEYEGKTLAESNMRRERGVTVLCIRRREEGGDGPGKVIMPGPDDVLKFTDKLIVFGESAAINELTAKGGV